MPFALPVKRHAVWVSRCIRQIPSHGSLHDLPSLTVEVSAVLHPSYTQLWSVRVEHAVYMLPTFAAVDRDQPFCI